MGPEGYRGIRGFAFAPVIETVVDETTGNVIETYGDIQSFSGAQQVSVEFNNVIRDEITQGGY